MKVIEVLRVQEQVEVSRKRLFEARQSLGKHRDQLSRKLHSGGTILWMWLFNRKESCIKK